MKQSIALIALLLGSFITPTVAQNSKYVSPVPNCGGQSYERYLGLVIGNRCNIQVTITWTSPGDIWGTAHLGPGGSQGTNASAEHVQRAGGVDLYVCPGDSSPVDPDDRFIGSHYRGEYRCKR
jgi:hypothetical protein